MEHLKLLLSFAVTVLGLLISTLTFLIKSIDNAKARKKASELLELCNALLPYMEKAEKFVNYTGEEKKEYVMTQVNRYALENGIKFDYNVVSSKIEEYIELSKEVNAKLTAKPLSTQKSVVIKIPKDRV